MKKNKNALLSLSAVLFICALIGCGPSSSGGGDTPPSPAEKTVQVPQNEDITSASPPLAAPESDVPQAGESPIGDSAPPNQAADDETRKPPKGSLKKGEPAGNAQTEIKDFGENRTKNLRLVAKKLSGRIIKAGEEFSFNKSVGRRTLSRGFRKAIVFKNEEKVTEVGGGICQVSTTLYQAALEAGFEITERHEHSLEVPYAKKGDDATVYYGKQDLRFVNTSGSDVRLECKIGKDSVYTGFTAV